MMNLNLDLPIFFHSDSSEILDNMNLGFSVSICVKREMYFMSIDSIAPYVNTKTGDVTFSQVFSGGQMFICAMKYDVLRALIIEHTNSH